MSVCTANGKKLQMTLNETAKKLNENHYFCGECERVCIWAGNKDGMEKVVSTNLLKY